MALKGIRVLEINGLAPAPFCGMILAEFGASVLRIDKNPPGPDIDCLANGKKSISINMKSNDGKSIVKKLVTRADVLIEPFRPGVMEKLGLGPDILMKENSRLVYARMSGYGQEGPMSKRAGHDMNYASYSGLLKEMYEDGLTPPPFVADFAGGGLLCAFGIVAALFERAQSGKGQVLDLSLSGGAAYVGSWLMRSKALSFWDGKKGENMLDGGSHFYHCYPTKDNKWIAVGALEPHFYEKVIQGLGLSPEEFPQYPEDPEPLKAHMREVFLQKTQDDWLRIFDSLDCCVTPVNTVEEAVAANPNGYVSLNCDKKGVWAPVPYPKLSRTPPSSLAMKPSPQQGEHSVDVLREIGFTENEIKNFMSSGAVLPKSKI